MTYGNSSNAGSRSAALAKRRKSAANTFGLIMAVPLFIAYFGFWHETFVAWLYIHGYLPDYGIMQFLEGPTRVNWDKILVAGVSGAFLATVGNIIAAPFLWLFMR